MPLTKASLKPKPKKAAPKPLPEPGEADAVLLEDIVASTNAAIEAAVQPDHHVIPEHDYNVFRPHDEARGCWCFPDIEGNEVRHR